MKRKLIEEYNWGVYIWKTPEGKVIKNENGDFLMIMSRKDDQKQIEKIRRAAKDCGVDDGEAIFWSGNRPVSEEEYQEQVARLTVGLVPDKLDYFAAKEELNSRKLNGTF
jgi:hypothetical protein